VIFSTSFAALLFTFVLLLIPSYAGRIRRGRDRNVELRLAPPFPLKRLPGA
jgi:hypothetical protein